MIRGFALACCLMLSGSLAWADHAASIRGISSQPALTEAEAIDAARNDAIESLLPRLRAAVALAIRQHTWPVPMPSEQSLRELIAAELACPGRMELERKVELRRRSYADVFFAEVVIDASPAMLERLTRRAVELSRASMQRNVLAGFTLSAALAVIGITYLTLNALTRGYFTWRLRLLAAAASALAIAGVSGTWFGHALGSTGG